MHDSVIFSKFTGLYNHYQNLVLEHFLSPGRDPFCRSAGNPHPYCQPQATTDLLSIPRDSLSLAIS